MFIWDINPMWQIESDLDKTSEVEICLIADGAMRTRVELEHRNLDRHGDGWDGIREGVRGDQGWRCTSTAIRPWSATAEDRRLTEPRHLVARSDQGSRCPLDSKSAVRLPREPHHSVVKDAPEGYEAAVIVWLVEYDSVIVMPQSLPGQSENERPLIRSYASM